MKRLNIKNDWVLSFVFVFAVCSLGSAATSNNEKHKHPEKDLTLSGLEIDPQNPLNVTFFLQKINPYSKLDQTQVMPKSLLFIQYFLTGLTTPEDQLWVNLSPYEADRIIPQSLAQTRLGQSLLSQDLMLKRRTSELLHPDQSLGERFWTQLSNDTNDRKVFDQVANQLLHKVWIIPGRVRVQQMDHRLSIVDSHLKLMLESDYYARKENQVSKTNDRMAQVMQEVLLPAIEKEVNETQNFFPLRQVYHALILASWYKEQLRHSVLNQGYFGKNKLLGLSTNDQQIKDDVYSAYQNMFRQGLFDMVREDYHPATQTITSQRYFAGGVKLFNPQLEMLSESSVRHDYQVSTNLNISSSTQPLPFPLKHIELNTVKLLTNVGFGARYVLIQLARGFSVHKEKAMKNLLDRFDQWPAKIWIDWQIITRINQLADLYRDQTINLSAQNRNALRRIMIKYARHSKKDSPIYKYSRVSLDSWLKKDIENRSEGLPQSPKRPFIEKRDGLLETQQSVDDENLDVLKNFLNKYSLSGEGPKMMVTDLDNTLKDANGQISSDLLDQLISWMEEGHYLAVATLNRSSKAYEVLNLLKRRLYKFTETDFMSGLSLSDFVIKVKKNFGTSLVVGAPEDDIDFLQSPELIFSLIQDDEYLINLKSKVAELRFPMLDEDYVKLLQNSIIENARKKFLKNFISLQELTVQQWGALGQTMDLYELTRLLLTVKYQEDLNNSLRFIDFDLQFTIAAWGVVLTKPITLRYQMDRKRERLKGMISWKVMQRYDFDKKTIQTIMPQLVSDSLVAKKSDFLWKVNPKVTDSMIKEALNLDNDQWSALQKVLKESRRGLRLNDVVDHEGVISIGDNLLGLDKWTVQAFNPYQGLDYAWRWLWYLMEEIGHVYENVWDMDPLAPGAMPKQFLDFYKTINRWAREAYFVPGVYFVQVSDPTGTIKVLNIVLDTWQQRKNLSTGLNLTTHSTKGGVDFNLRDIGLSLKPTSQDAASHSYLDVEITEPDLIHGIIPDITGIYSVSPIPH